MKTDWDYSDLADAYLKRPDYADTAIDAMLRLADVGAGARVCDVGAGVAHLTIKLAERGLKVDSVELKNLSGTPDELAQVIGHEVLGEVVSAAAVELLKAKASEKLNEIFNRDKD